MSVWYDNVSGLQQVQRKYPTYKTGFGDEVYYHDDQGFLHHIPVRTKWTHPYSYDPIVLINTTVKPTSSAYSDRMQGWDYTNYEQSSNRAAEKYGRRFEWSDEAIVRDFLRAYYKDGTIEVAKVIEMCNASNGYPLWFLSWSSSKKEAKPKKVKT